MEQINSEAEQTHRIIESFRAWIAGNQMANEKEKSLFLTVLTICAYELYMGGDKAEVGVRIANALDVAHEGWREDVH